MIIVDRALGARVAEGRPIRVALVGAGALGRGLTHQFVHAAQGMELVAIVNRTPESAVRAWQLAGIEDPKPVGSPAELERAIGAGRPAVSDDPAVLTAGPIDAIVEATGTVEFGAGVALAAIDAGKHVFINAELDGTIGPELQARAASAGVIVSALDGDQPGTQLNLYRFASGLGFEPLLCGNIKGLEDHYRTPETQRGFASRWGLTAMMATSFADGTKISFEQTVVANATGMGVARRGMLGHAHDGLIDEMTGRFDPDELRAMGGIVDYALGAKPSPGVFVFAAHPDARQRGYLEFWKMGPGPLYSFYAPYHLAHMEAPLSIARAVLFGDATTTAHAPVVEVIALAKRDLCAGEILDGVGGYTVYGACENRASARADDLLPMGLAEGGTLVRDVPRDTAITFADVSLPAGRQADILWREQNARFGAAAVAPKRT